MAAVAEAGLARMRALTDPAETFAGVSHVQECVTEDLAVKRAVFRLAAEHAPADALLATSSSGLSISQIQEDVPGPERCLAAHPYNPPHLVPLVELAPGALTAPETIERARAFYRSVGKTPVVVHRDVPGYIGNRLSAALWREAVELVRSGVASVEEVDSAVRNGPGLRWAVMGPHLLYHLGGGAGGIRGHLEHLAGRQRRHVARPGHVDHVPGRHRRRARGGPRRGDGRSHHGRTRARARRERWRPSCACAPRCATARPGPGKAGP